MKALREALHIDASPALDLLSNPRPEVRVAALAALEFRQNWRPGQPQVILQLAQHAIEPEVRSAAINALANVDDRTTIEALAEFLRDSSPLVRQTAAEALLWNTEQNWPWIRLAVRRASGRSRVRKRWADTPRREHPDCRGGGRSDRVDFRKGRAIAAGGADARLPLYSRVVVGAGYDVGGDAAPPARRKAIRRRCYDWSWPACCTSIANWICPLLRQLLDPANPAPLRLIAVEALLEHGDSTEAVSTLHDLARLPNREIALGIAQVVQRRLGVDLGLPRDEPLPPVHSRLAAEVARRVLIWASHHGASPEVAIRGEEPGWHELSNVEESPR